jgi:hypothetical protein
VIWQWHIAKARPSNAANEAARRIFILRVGSICWLDVDTEFPVNIVDRIVLSVER